MSTKKAETAATATETPVETTPRMRPCRPGDVLWRMDGPPGWRAVVEVCAPAAHPPSGVTKNHNITLQLTVSWRAADGMRQPLPGEYLDHSVKVMGQKLEEGWGEFLRTRQDCHAGWAMAQWTQIHSLAIAPALADLSAMGREALATVQAVVDRHAASIAAQASARAAAYAAWPVADTEVTP